MFYDQLIKVYNKSIKFKLIKFDSPKKSILMCSELD